MDDISGRISYKQEPDHNYLLIRQEEYEPDFQTEMLVRNRIPGFLPCRLHLKDREAEFCYEITSRQSLREVLETKRLGYEDFRVLLEGIFRAVESSREYLLEPGSILLRPEYIYTEPDGGRCCFCSFPCYDGSIREELERLAEYCLEKLDRQDQGAVTLGYEFYRASGEKNLSLREILKGRPEETGEAEKEEREEEISPQISCKGQRETERKEIAEGLTLYGKSPAHPTWEITGDSFLIGKKKKAVNGWLKARGISGVHAKITKEEGVYYLTDLNSAKGTFLNGGRLEVNEKARIRPGDCVEFGEAEYQVDGENRFRT